MEGSRFFYTEFISELGNHAGAESRAGEMGHTATDEHHTRRYIRYACGLELQRALHGEQAEAATAEALSASGQERGRGQEENR